MSGHTPWVVVKTRRALATLNAARHPDEVAELLRAADVRGVPCVPWRCPVAVYLRRRGDVALRDGVSVAKRGARVCVLDAFGDRRWYDVGAFTASVARFVERFDLEGGYPDLRERPPAPETTEEAP